jgi:hypothetical protein
MIAHACNLSYSGDGGRRTEVWGRGCWECGSSRTALAWQAQGPELKPSTSPHHHQKKKEEEENCPEVTTKAGWEHQKEQGNGNEGMLRTS